jgi:hypothetical protein
MRGRAILVTLGLAVTWGACVEVDGGAVEVSWKVFSPSGGECPEDGSRCETGRVGTVQIRAQRVDVPDGGAAAVAYTRDFPCQAATGSTRFDLPAGRYAVDLVPTPAGACTGGPCRFTTPPPLVKDVEYGKVAQMGLVLITVENSPACP